MKVWLNFVKLGDTLLSCVLIGHIHKTQTTNGKGSTVYNAAKEM